LRKTPEPIGQQARWQSFIEQFTFEIRHRPGTRHLNADALSRIPVLEDDDEFDDENRRLRVVTSKKSDETERQLQIRSGESMAVLQQEDTDVGPILRLRLKESSQPRPEKVLPESDAAKTLCGQWHSLVVKDDVLYRKVEAKNGRLPMLQLIVPAVKRTEFIKGCHEGITGGHRAFRTTSEQVRRRGFWPGWRKDVKRYCRQCQNCCSFTADAVPAPDLFNR